MSSANKADREAVIDFEKYTDQKIRVSIQGGREVEGILKGYDKLENLVLDESIEYLRDPKDFSQVTDKTRKLGLIVIRGPQISLIAPADEREEIANPFADVEEEGEEEEGK